MPKRRTACNWYERSFHPLWQQGAFIIRAGRFAFRRRVRGRFNTRASWTRWSVAALSVGSRADARVRADTYEQLVSRSTFSLPTLSQRTYKLGKSLILSIEKSNSDISPFSVISVSRKDRQFSVSICELIRRCVGGAHFICRNQAVSLFVPATSRARVG